MTTIGAPQAPAVTMPGARFRTETADQVRQGTAETRQQTKLLTKIERRDESMAQQALKSKEATTENFKASHEAVVKEYAAQEKYVAAAQALADQAMQSRVAANKADAKVEASLRDTRVTADRQVTERKKLELETAYATTQTAEAGKRVNQSA